MELVNQGSARQAASILSISNAIDAFQPDAVILVGVAFGAGNGKDTWQDIGDVIVSKTVTDYESGIIRNGGFLSDGTIVEAGKFLTSIFNTFSDSWTFNLKNRLAKCFIGNVLSGDKFVDDYHFKTQLFERYPLAYGGEMEGRGAYAACRDRGIDEWIIVKGICDWGDGNTSKNKLTNQKIAAKSAVSLLMHIFSQPNIFDKLQFKKSYMNQQEKNDCNIVLKEYYKKPGNHCEFASTVYDKTYVSSFLSGLKSKILRETIKEFAKIKELYLSNTLNEFGSTTIKQELILNAVCEDGERGQLMKLFNRLKDENTFIIGPGGSGKSTFISKIFQSLINNLCEGIIPIYIDLRTYSIEYSFHPNDYTLLYHIAKKFRITQYVSELEDLFLERKSSKKEVFIFCENLHSIGNMYKRPIVNELNELMRLWDNVKFVITSRYSEEELFELESKERSLKMEQQKIINYINHSERVDFEEDNQKHLHILKRNRITISPLDKTDILKYLYNINDKKEIFSKETIDNILNNTRLMKILAVPFFLVRFVEIIIRKCYSTEVHNFLPQIPGEILKEYFSVFKKQIEDNNVVITVKNGITFPTKTIIFLLEYFLPKYAFQMQCGTKVTYYNIINSYIPYTGNSAILTNRGCNCKSWIGYSEYKDAFKEFDNQYIEKFDNLDRNKILEVREKDIIELLSQHLCICYLDNNELCFVHDCYCEFLSAFFCLQTICGLAQLEDTSYSTLLFYPYCRATWNENTLLYLKDLYILDENFRQKLEICYGLYSKERKHYIKRYFTNRLIVWRICYSLISSLPVNLVYIILGFVASALIALVTCFFTLNDIKTGRNDYHDLYYSTLKNITNFICEYICDDKLVEKWSNLAIKYNYQTFRNNLISFIKSKDLPNENEVKNIKIAMRKKIYLNCTMGLLERNISQIPRKKIFKYVKKMAFGEDEGMKILSVTIIATALGSIYDSQKFASKSDEKMLIRFLNRMEKKRGKIGAYTQNQLAIFYLECGEKEKAAGKFFQAAANGLLEAKYYLGLLFVWGEGVEKNEKIAMEYFREAAETDNTKNVDAMLRIGDMYYRGIGVEEDINQALKWYTKAVTRNESENVDVIRIIGRTYYFGEGIEKDYSMAYKWFKIAAEKNDAFSQLILGDMYWYGKGVASDVQVAKVWYGKAANQGNITAMLKVADLYYYEGNKKSALVWYLKVAKEGNVEAMKKVLQYYKGGLIDYEEYNIVFRQYKKKLILNYKKTLETN